MTYKDHVIGVLSGSIQEGGSIAWAISAKYVKNMTQVNQHAPYFTTWPPLTLMNSSSHSLRSQTALGTLLVAALKRYGETANAAADASVKVIRSCDELYGQLDELLNIVNHEINRRCQFSNRRRGR